MSEQMTKDWEKDAAYAVMDDLRDRRGILDGIDDDVMEEIKSAIHEIIVEHSPDLDSLRDRLAEAEARAESEQMFHQRFRQEALEAIARAEQAESQRDAAKESIAEEIQSNIELFDLLGLRSGEDFGHDTPNEAIARKFNEMKSQRDAAIAAVAEARAVAEMAVSDECGLETDGPVQTHWQGEEVEPEEWCRRRLLELRQNVRDVEWMAIGNWREPLRDSAAQEGDAR